MADISSTNGAITVDYKFGLLTLPEGAAKASLSKWRMALPAKGPSDWDRPFLALARRLSGGGAMGLVAVETPDESEAGHEKKVRFLGQAWYGGFHLFKPDVCFSSNTTLYCAELPHWLAGDLPVQLFGAGIDRLVFPTPSDMLNRQYADTILARPKSAMSAAAFFKANNVSVSMIEAVEENNLRNQVPYRQYAPNARRCATL